MTQTLKVAFTTLAIFAAVPLLAMTVKDGQVTFEKVDEFDACMKEQPEARCTSALEKWTAANPKDSFKAAKMVQTDVNAQTAAPFFASAFKNSQGDCKDESVKKFTLEGLALSSANASAVETAKQIAFTHCFEQLKPALVDRVQSSSADYKKNTCAGLVKAKALSGLKLKYCEAAAK